MCLIFPWVANAQLEEIDWTKVESRVAWFNGYEQPGLYTLKVNGVPALRNQASAGLFSPTKFPSGSFSAEIEDSRDRSVIFSDGLTILPTGDHLLVTSGNAPSNTILHVIHSSDFPEVENKKRITFINARSGATCKLEIPLPDDAVETIEIDGIFSAVFNAEEDSPEIKLVVKMPDGSARTERISPRELSPNGAVFIVHTDSDYFTALQISMVSAETFSLAGSDIDPVPIDQ